MTFERWQTASGKTAFNLVNADAGRMQRRKSSSRRLADERASGRMGRQMRKGVRAARCARQPRSRCDAGQLCGVHVRGTRQWRREGGLLMMGTVSVGAVRARDAFRVLQVTTAAL